MMTRLQTRISTRIQSSWSSYNYYPDVAKVQCAAALVTSGHLPQNVMTKLATRIQLQWSCLWYYFNPSVAEVRSASALAATGHLTKVKNMNLRDLELPSSQDMPSLARVVSGKVELRNVTGDLGPLLSSLSCTRLLIENMELDQAATSSLVRGLQHGVEKLVLGFHGRVRLHIQTLLEWDGRGRCGEVVCWDDTRDTYRRKMETWAARVNWSVSKESSYIVMRRK